MSEVDRRVAWYLWPFHAIWRLVTFVVRATGRLFCGLLGIALLIAGTTVALTLVGAPIGVPLALLGLLLLFRALF